jgi:hypothetical protein
MTRVALSTLLAVNHLMIAPTFHLPAETPVGEALLAVGKATHRRVVSDPTVYDYERNRVVARELRGPMEIRDALCAILADSERSYQLVPDADNSLVVTPDLSITKPPGAIDCSIRHFEIPEGPINETLDVFFRQGHITTFSDPRVVHSQHTNAVSGYFEPERALELLVSGTGLDYLQEGKYTFVVRGYFDIPAGAARNTLRDFGRQAVVSIVSDPQLVNVQHTSAVHGYFGGLEEALGVMLQDSGLEQIFVDAHTIAVRPRLRASPDAVLRAKTQRSMVSRAQRHPTAQTAGAPQPQDRDPVEGHKDSECTCEARDRLRVWPQWLQQLDDEASGHWCVEDGALKHTVAVTCPVGR